MINERQYQIDLNERVAEEVSTRRKVLMQLPTGGGKTVCFAKLAQRFIRNTEKAVLIMVHREELMFQAAKTIEEMLNIKPYLITSQTKRLGYSRVYIGMVESTIPRLEMMSNVGMIIIDECHIANFNKVHSIFLEELIIGVTATPVSSNKREPLNKYYSCMIAGPQIEELIKMGFLAQNITRCPKDIVDASKFQVDKMKGDYNERQMSDEYRLPRFVENVASAYHKYCEGTKTLVFNVNIEHSKEVCRFLVMYGYNARHLDSTTGLEDRRETLKWFKETEDAILCNVMITTVGFDEPTVRNIILNFSTLSIVKFIQCSGRGSRPIDQAWLDKYQKDYPYLEREKHHFQIIDMGGNWTKFGDWSNERDWEYMFNHPYIPGEGVAPVKTCPECEGLVHAAAMVCTLTNHEGQMCLHEFMRKPRPEEQELQEMIAITKNIDIDSLIGKEHKKYQYYTFLELGNQVVQDMFKNSSRVPSIGTEQKYFKAYYKLCVDWYAKSMSGKDGNMDDISTSGWHIKLAKNNFNRCVEVYNKKYDLRFDKIEELQVYDENKERYEQAIIEHPLMINYVPSEHDFAEDIILSEGVTVEHKNLGKGKVIQILTDFEVPIAVIDFENHGERKIITKYAKMRLSETQTA